MSHMIGKVRRRARRRANWAARGSGDAVRRALRPGGIQAKLKVGATNDAYEREADAVAARVMAGPLAPAPIAAGAPIAAQRMCAECEDEAKGQRAEIQRQPVEEEEEELQAKARPDGLQRQEEEEEELQAKARPDGLQRQEEEEEELQAKSKATGPFTASAGVSARVSALKGGGQPLPTSTRAFFEPRFGASFADVRVHTGPRAAAAAKALNARAFTTGRDVVFGDGEYAPTARSGGELLAHELTHVVQQRGYRREPGAEAEPAAPVQRWDIGAAPAPRGHWSLVPSDPAVEDQRTELDAAEAIVRGVLNSRRCVNFFRDNCGLGEGDAALQSAFDQAQVYFLDQDDNVFGEQAGTSRNIAYNRRAFRIGEFFMAGTLLHEMFHTCDPSFDPTDEIDAENAVEACRIYRPFIFDLSATSGAVGSQVTITGIGFGGAQGSTDRVTFNGVNATIVSWGFVGTAGNSATRIVCEVPTGATTGDLVVINNRVASNRRRFRVT